MIKKMVKIPKTNIELGKHYTRVNNDVQFPLCFSYSYLLWRDVFSPCNVPRYNTTSAVIITMNLRQYSTQSLKATLSSPFSFRPENLIKVQKRQA